MITNRILATYSLLGILSPVLISGSTSDDWATYLGRNGAHYSELDAINRGNVSRLKVAWEFRTGDASHNSQIQCNPLVVGGTLYGTTPQLQLFALDAASGRELWRFDPFQQTEGALVRRGVNRGLAIWTAGNDSRILYTAGHYIHAVDSRTGKLIEGFGNYGRVDLMQGLDRDVSGLYVAGTSPSAVYKDTFIVSTRVGEGPGPAAPGHIRGYDVRTGKRRWIFHTIPLPGQFGINTWPADAWKVSGGANNWMGMVVDQETGTAFVPTGSAAFDFWGGDRLGDNLFANCLIALDAETGVRKWHFQFVRHDLWDRDPPAAPVLCSVYRNGKKVAAVAQVTKSGHVWLFDRLTGESLFPWEQIAVPASKLLGEVAAATQPMPLKPVPFARQRFTESEVTDRTPEAHRAVLERLRQLDPHVPFAPPSEAGTIIFPGFDGGAEWGGPAVDPEAILYVNSNEMAWIHQMIPVNSAGGSLGQRLYNQHCGACHGTERAGNPAGNIPSLLGLNTRLGPRDVEGIIKNGRGAMPAFGFLAGSEIEALVSYLLENKAKALVEDSAIMPKAGAKHEVTGGEPSTTTPYSSTGYNRFLDPDGYPAIKPPWGTLNAIDLNSGEYLWSRPLGELPELTKAGMAPTGTENYGGPIVTAGGLLFIGATKDEMFRAFDKRTGELLWEYKLPAGGYATPTTYAVNGKQYVVIACGGGKMGTPSGDSYLAFAIPEPEP